jgi:hypothetical protein
MTSAAIAAAGATTTGGLAAIVLRLTRRDKPLGPSPEMEGEPCDEHRHEARDGHEK